MMITAYLRLRAIHVLPRMPILERKYTRMGISNTRPVAKVSVEMNEV
jgi:hypothetical protein